MAASMALFASLQIQIYNVRGTLQIDDEVRVITAQHWHQLNILRCGEGNRSRLAWCACYVKSQRLQTCMLKTTADREK